MKLWIKVLYLAARDNHTCVVELLLRKGAAIETKGEDNNTPLHFAARKGHIGVVELLLRKGALIEAMNKNGITPMRSSGHWKVVELLRGNRASVCGHK